MPILYYINSDLNPGQVPVTWKDGVVTMSTLALRASASVMWAAGYDVLLETPFFEYFDSRYGRNGWKGIDKHFSDAYTERGNQLAWSPPH
jgi:hypothetical protein